MPQFHPIICRPTSWFIFRASVMVLMFGVFSVLFYIDGSTGYRKKNENFYLNKTFENANDQFAKMNSSGSLTPKEWETYAAKQSVAFPKDSSILPTSLKLPMPWPAVLHDFDKMKSLQWNILWREYTKENGLNASPPEEPYDAQKIREQWIVGGVCAGLVGIAGFILLRTLMRSISVDDQAITSSQGKRILFSDLKVLDLRKWETKGLAFIDYDGESGQGRIRIDGLTYGGFKSENDQPAEQLMKKIQTNFSGEVIEYIPFSSSESASDQKSSSD